MNCNGLSIKISSVSFSSFVDVPYVFQTVAFPSLKKTRGRVSELNNYPLVMTNIAMENHHFKFGKPLFLWVIYTIAMLVITRGYTQSYPCPTIEGNHGPHRNDEQISSPETFHLDMGQNYNQWEISRILK